MASSKKKRSSMLIILLIAMIVLIGACFWLTRYKDEKAKVESEEDTTEDTSSTIASLDVDSIASVYFSNESGGMTLIKDTDGIWKNSEDELFPVNQTYVGSMSSAFASVTSSRTITETTEDLSSFGLDKPTIKVIATLKDGTTTSIAIGNEVPVAGGYYATANGSSEIYIIAADFYNNFNHTLTEMTAIETIPTITAENVTHLKVEYKDKPNFEVSFDENNSVDFAGITNWTMKQPYATEIPADKEALTTLFGNYSAMSFLACVDYNAKDLSKYGLDDPTATISLEYYDIYTKDTETTDSTDESSTMDTDTAEAETTKLYKDYELVIGMTDEAGNYYAKSKDSTAVHTISADTVATLTGIDAYSNAYHNINLINLEAIDKIDVDINGETYAMTSEKSTETVDDVEAEVTNYYFNGKLADEEQFKTLYLSMIAPTTERDIPAEYFASSKSRTPYMTITYHFISDKTVTIQYLPYDDSYYVVDTNGVEYFLTDIRKIKEVADAVVNFKK